MLSHHLADKNNSDGLYLLILLGAMLACFIYIPPFYEVPQNDDWAYFQSLEYWIKTGELKHWGWNDPILLFQLWWGKLFASIFGLSYSTLRCSTLVLFMCGIIAMYFLQVELAIPRKWATLGALMLFFNPFSLTLAYSFNTDIPYLSLIIIGQLFLIRGVSRDHILCIALASLFMVLAFLVRQTALFVIVSSVLYVYFFTNLKRKKLAAAIFLLPFAIAFLLYLQWMSGQEYKGWPYASNNSMISFANTSKNEIAGFFVNAAIHGYVIFLHLSLLMIPLLTGCTATQFRDQSTRGKYALFIIPLIYVILLLWLESSGDGWPFIGNYLTREGIFPGDYRVFIGDPQTQMGVFSDDYRTFVAPYAWFNILALLSVFFAIKLTFQISKTAKQFFYKTNSALCALVFFGLIQFLPMLLLEVIYDRYILVLLPATIIYLMKCIKDSKFKLCLALSIFLFVQTIEYTRVYIDRAKLRWEIAHQLVEEGVKPESIYAGFEWSASYLYPLALDRLGARPPFVMKPEALPWHPLEHFVCLVGEQKTYVLYKEYPSEFYLHKRKVGAQCYSGRPGNN